MKKLLFLLVLVSACVAAKAQRTTFVNRNGEERYGYSLITTDSDYHNVDSVVFKTNEGGILVVTVVGYAKDTALCVTGIKKVRFNKHRGTLTMGTVIDDMAVVIDTGLGSSTFDLIAANNKIYVRVKGQDATNITWTSIIKRKTVSYGN